MRKIFSAIVLTLSVVLFAQEEEGFPKIPSRGKIIDAFIPKGWKQITMATGDLNKDENEDVVIIIENTDPKYIIESDSDEWPEKLNLNDRCLILLFKVNEGYMLTEHSFTFLPRASDRHTPCLEDPLLESGGIAIKDGVLRIELGYFSRCGSFDNFNQTFKFRHQDNAMRLIGYDIYNLSRSTGDETEASFNFITGKKSETRGGNEFYPEISKPRTEWKNIDIQPIFLRDFGTPPVNFEID